MFIIILYDITFINLTVHNIIMTKKQSKNVPIEAGKDCVVKLLQRSPMHYRDLSCVIQTVFDVSKMKAGWFLHDMCELRFLLKHPVTKIHSKTVIYILPLQREEAAEMYYKWFASKNIPHELITRMKSIHKDRLKKVVELRRSGMSAPDIAAILNIGNNTVREYITELLNEGRL